MSGGFEAMGLSPELQRGIYDVGYTLPTEVQGEAIPLILGGGDHGRRVRQGSGKTAAFSLPILELVHEKLKEAPAADVKEAPEEATTTEGPAAPDARSGRYFGGRRRPVSIEIRALVRRPLLPGIAPRVASTPSRSASRTRASAERAGRRKRLP